MTSFLNFTIDSFRKRKELFHLFLIQIFASIMLYYIVILANVLSNTFYTSIILNVINSSISNYWGAFFIILSVISLVFTSALVLFTIRLMIFYQTKDISVMVAIGGIIEVIENFYLVQLILMCLASNIIGIAVAYVSVFIVLAFTLFILPINVPIVLPFPDYQVVIFFILFFFSTYLLAGRLITGIVKKYHEELVQDKIDFNDGKDDNIIARFFIWGKRSKEGFINLTTRIARLNIMRHSFVFIISLIINILYAFFLISVIFGTLVISDTTNNVSYTGVGGDNTIMIVKSDFKSLFSQSFNIDSKLNVSNSDLQDSFFNFQSLVPVFKSFNVSSYDDRVISIRSIYAQNPPNNVNPQDPFNNGQNDLGSSRLKTPFVIALNPLKAIPFWNYYGSNPRNITGSNIFVGEQFAYTSFSTPMNGKLYFDGYSQTYFTINSIVLDPIFKGNTLYMNMIQYQSLFKPNTQLRNLVFIKLPDYKLLSNFINEIEKSNPDLTAISLNTAIQHNSNFNNQFLIYLLFIGIPLLGTYFILSDSYNRQIIEERKQQLNLIKILGGTRNNYRSIILKEVDGFTFWGLLLGYLLATYFIIEMTVPFPVISLLAVSTSVFILVIPYIIIRKRLIQRIDQIYNNYIES